MTKVKVLIVEDEIITAMALKEDLKKLGYKICSIATSGKKAIEIVEKEQPDVVLMDVRLRGEMDGVEAAKEIRTRFGVPSIFRTGYPDEKIKERAGITEPYEVLIKPVQSLVVKESIDKVLQKETRSQV